jgi:hypothetical protein
MAPYQLAQVDIALPRAPLESELLADFVKHRFSSPASEAAVEQDDSWFCPAKRRRRGLTAIDQRI